MRHLKKYNLGDRCKVGTLSGRLTYAANRSTLEPAPALGRTRCAWLPLASGLFSQRVLTIMLDAAVKALSQILSPRDAFHACGVRLAWLLVLIVVLAIGLQRRC